MTTNRIDERLDHATALLKWLRSTGRRVWVDAQTGLEFDDEFGLTSDQCADLLAAHDDIVRLIRAEELIAAFKDGSLGGPPA